jgi:hypothetical protein
LVKIREVVAEVLEEVEEEVAEENDSRDEPGTNRKMWQKDVENDEPELENQQRGMARREADEFLNYILGFTTRQYTKQRET